MSEHDEWEFQQGLEEALRRYDPGGTLAAYMKLDKGSDVTNLKLQADVLVGHVASGMERYISVLAYEWVKFYFERCSDLRDFDPWAAGNLVVAQPIVLVDRLTPDSAARAILRYVRIELPPRPMRRGGSGEWSR